MAAKQTLSVVIPAYNEERFLGQLLEKVLAVDLADLCFRKEVIVVDDGSKDRTATIAEGFGDVELIRQVPNQGKGAAVRAGLARASGDAIIIQDADLEYDPEDYRPMLEALAEPGVDVVYGSRYIRRRGQGSLSNWLGGKHKQQSWPAYCGGRSLSFACWTATGADLSDTVTALKLFRREIIKPLQLVTSGFELDHEITSKVLASGAKIVEVPIRYYPRSKAEGKKIGLRDFFIALRTFQRFRNG